MRKVNLTKEFLYDEYLVKKKSMTIIGDENNIDHRSVAYWIDKYGIQRRNREEERLNKLEREKGFLFTVENILDLVNQGYFIKDIALKYGVSRGTVSSFLSRKGINMRNHILQREKQSKLISLNNPIPKGSVRSDEDREKMSLNKRFKNKDLFLNWIEDKVLYVKRARYLAWDRYNFIPENLEVDHIFSVEDGYTYKVPIYLISHPHNLRLVTKKENLEKASFSIMSYDEFKRIVGIQRLFRNEVVSNNTKAEIQSFEC